MATRSTTPSDSSSQQVLTVAELTTQIKDLFEGTFPSVWVSGEISDLARPRSGHFYLSLKDEDALIRAVVWRSTAQRLRFELEDGLEVICQGSLDVYPPRGAYQLVIRQIEPKGIGALQQAFRRLRERLEREGLFRPEQKKPLPNFPRRIALVTSPSGAAVRDFLEVLRRRWPDVEVLVIPTRVQGEGAATEIAEAIDAANRLTPCPDVMVVARGGGSLEDLWSFNEEIVVRAIFTSEVPVISAVGHEIDVTLADLVADVRALTPTEAAERILPAVDEVRGRLRDAAGRLAVSLHRQAAQGRSRLDGLAARRVLARPHEQLQDLARRLDEMELRTARAVRGRWRHSRDRFTTLSGKLESLSPLAVLARGYSVTTHSDDGQLILSSDTLSVGEQITSRLAHGHVVSRIEQLGKE